MITFWQQENDKLRRCESPERDSERRAWLDARQVSREDIRVLKDEYGVLEEHILDILDTDELSRVEKEDGYTLIILRLPLFQPSEDVSYVTVPLGIILSGNCLVTICGTDCEVLHDLSENRAKRLSLSDFPAFIIHVLSHADNTFLRYLKEINRRSTLIQNELQRSVQNDELIKLLNLEKSLVFFTTSLKSNQLLLEKLYKTRFLHFDEDDRDWLADVEIDNRQAIEMADTYSDILSGMMDAFASVISNNLNIIMKKLTIISLILMVPTLIVSFFGMNIPLPLPNFGYVGISVVLALCIGASLAAHFMLNRTDEHPKKRRVKREGRKKTRKPETSAR
ncbi:magnesium transporter CorA family protein [Treponema endosymbiont of Eucomonympha sp.]|uniref:magnesium transporter CorA family protein n=1 Tax=Treponema endosymbiont of Eucomonympha sp. TaxID=1580831 RepID=UPI00078116F4|nr:magnesium transporter CorA family protein [Treponema endosymbiont of Eucomonympha sp.]